MAFQGQGAPAVAFVTLGCAKNEVDTVHMRDRVAAAGFAVADDPECADAIIVNTCSFIQAATEESLEAVFEAASLDAVAAGEAVVIVAGCMPARYGDELSRSLTEAAAFVPCADEERIADVVASALGLAAPPVAYGAPPEPAADEGGAPYAYVKISDGCDRRCSYCTIPTIRGCYRSLSFEEVEGEVAAAEARGAREVVLVAQDTGRWGSDFAAPATLASLVARLAETHPGLWFRMMYVQPDGVTDELIETVASHANVCDYFDIPVQHASARVLRAMGRGGSAESFRALAARIRRLVPDAALRTTVIAGFPGETDGDFDELVSFVEEGVFDYVGVFPYSREEGTSAAELPGQLSEEEKAERASIVRSVADAVGAARAAARVGQEAEVLVCGREEDGQLFGRARFQAPDVDGCVYLDAGEVGEVARVRLTGSMLYELEGETL